MTEEIKKHDKINTPQKVQLVCPYCKKEFPFDNGRLDEEIERAKKKHQSMSAELAHLKSRPISFQKKNEGKIKRLGLEIQDTMQVLTALKKARKLKDQQLNMHKFYLYRSIVEREYGYDVDRKILCEAIKELEAYEIGQFMKRDYSKSNSKKDVTSINKL
jgi:hypothetical protein